MDSRLLAPSPTGVRVFIDVMGKLFPFRCLFNASCLIPSQRHRNEGWKAPHEVRRLCLCSSSPQSKADPEHSCHVSCTGHES